MWLTASPRLAMSTLPAEVELHPHLVYRVDGDSARCALWRLEQGERAVAIFSTEELAEGYRRLLGEGAWRVTLPDQDGLLNVFRGCQAEGVRFAVLDPDGRQAKRIFDLKQVLERAAG
jgi:hypothetical protein